MRESLSPLDQKLVRQGKIDKVEWQCYIKMMKMVLLWKGNQTKKKMEWK